MRVGQVRSNASNVRLTMLKINVIIVLKCLWSSISLLCWGQMPMPIGVGTAKGREIETLLTCHLYPLQLKVPEAIVLTSTSLPLCSSHETD